MIPPIDDFGPTVVFEAAFDGVKRTRSGKAIHDFRGLHGQLGTLTMNRIEPSGPGKRGFDVPSSSTPVQDPALRVLNTKVPCCSPSPAQFVQSLDGGNPKI